jgi:hypothetical protein
LEEVEKLGSWEVWKLGSLEGFGEEEADEIEHDPEGLTEE